MNKNVTFLLIVKNISCVPIFFVSHQQQKIFNVKFFPNYGIPYVYGTSHMCMVTLYTYDDVAQLNIATIIPQGIQKKAKSVNIAGSYSCSMHETCMNSNPYKYIGLALNWLEWLIMLCICSLILAVSRSSFFETSVLNSYVIL